METPPVASRDAAKLLHEGALALSSMERNGIRIDMRYLESHTKETEVEIEGLKKRLYADKMWKEWEKKFGNKATLGNKVQLGSIVFDDMGYTRRHSLAKKDRKSNDEYAFRRAPKNDEASFGSVDLPFVKDYFRWQKLEKLYGTYLKGIMNEVVDGRIHPFYHANKVVSYRTSSSMINFQNIPNRNKEIARRIRRCFIPDKGCVIGDFDYSTAEVRSACCYTKDPNLIRDFTEKGKDAHGDLAVELFGMDREKMRHWTEDMKVAFKKTLRDWIKNRFTFPQFFGSVYFQCAPHLWEGVTSGKTMPDGKMSVVEHLRRQGVTELGDCDQDAFVKPGTFVHRVKTLEDSMWNKRYTVYTAWKKRWRNSYLIKGWFESLSGFVFSGLYGRNDCLNYGIQCFAAHWLLQAAIIVSKKLRKARMKTRLIGAIHDNLLGSIPHDEVQDVFDMIVEAMTVDVPKKWPSIIVPLEAEVEWVPEGGSWAEKKLCHKSRGRWEVAA